MPPGLSALEGEVEEPRLETAPQSVEAAIVGARFLTLRWKPPLHTLGEITSYSVFYREQDSFRYIIISLCRRVLHKVFKYDGRLESILWLSTTREGAWLASSILYRQTQKVSQRRVVALARFCVCLLIFCLEKITAALIEVCYSLALKVNGFYIFALVMFVVLL